MTARCLRCPPDANTVDDPELHATEHGHPLCARCRRSLRLDEANACHVCIDRLRQNLADLIDAYERLPEAAQQVGGSRHTPPGGQFLYLAGPGSDGLTGLTGARLSIGGVDDSHAADELPADPPSIAHELGSLEQDWRRAFGHPAAGPPPQPPSLGLKRNPRGYLNGMVRQSVAYLQKHAAWCATAYPDGFVEAAETVWQLRRRLYGALGLLEPRQVQASCLHCATVGGESRLEQGDAWWCPRCGGSWSPGEYFQALRSGLEARHAG